MGIRSEEAIALGRIADKLQSLDNTMRKIEMDLHSIDISLGAMKPQTINDIRQKYGFKIVPNKDVLGEYFVLRDEYMSDMHAYMNKEENNENRN